MKNKSNNLFENSEKIKEHRWILLLVFLIITISKGIIKNVIGADTYNIIIIFIMSAFGIYLGDQFIEYVKNNEKYDIKNMKKELIICFFMILATVIYLGFLLII